MAINTNASGTPATRGWGPGWPNCQSSKIVPLHAKKADFPGGIRKELKVLVEILLARTEQKGYKMIPGWCWGYACRAIKTSSGGTTNVPSNHSWGLAIDVNAPANPFGGSSHDIPPFMVSLFHRYGFRWGGEYHGTKDWMHFEFMGSPMQARWMTRKAKREFPGLV